ncbi:MAG TPA: CHAP domain-containing protein [Crocinitomicaceae bacterium]|nr:CHAP domain-containing protein [Crocinitomicaceae bacterium]
MKKHLILFCALFLYANVHAQNPKIDKLEMLFSQKHYKRVYRKANRLLDNPEYDFSMMPTYYKSLSLFQLAQNKYWFGRHDQALVDAKRLFLKVKNSENGQKIFNAHMYEIAWLKEDLISWASDLKRMGEGNKFNEVQKVIEQTFGEFNLAVLPDEHSHSDESIVVHTEVGTVRSDIIKEAKRYIGVPYIWAGASPKGFDCSGFTSYVLSKSGKELPRRSSDQYSSSNKIKQKDVQPGDLVFFSNGQGISHVGIVVSEKGSPLTMIHASSSKGIIITNVEQSTYWSKRLKGFGTYVN